MQKLPARSWLVMVMMMMAMNKIIVRKVVARMIKIMIMVMIMMMMTIIMIRVLRQGLLCDANVTSALAGQGQREFPGRTSSLAN